jgi:hypothetical protein
MTFIIYNLCEWIIKYKYWWLNSFADDTILLVDGNNAIDVFVYDHAVVCFENVNFSWEILV